MLPILRIGDKIFQWLIEIDEETRRRVAVDGCQHCGGPLHRADYPRKPRGGLLAVAGEVLTKRISLCCGWEGCRRRSTPPSVIFLGRRVYVGVAVVLAVIVAETAARAREVRRRTGVAPRTVSRWREWWRTKFPESRLYREEQARFMPPLEQTRLPGSLVERFERAGRSADEVLVHVLGFLAPLGTTSVTIGASFVRAE